MAIVIRCPGCSQRYQVADGMQGKRVRCQQCGNSFTASVPVTPSPPALPQVAPPGPGNGLEGIDLADLPALAAPAPLHRGAPPLGSSTAASTAWSGTAAAVSSVSNPSGGPTDAVLRLVCCGMLALGAVLSVGSLISVAAQGAVYLGVLILVPLMFVLGIAGLISPNVVRAVGKYGGHLPWQYKAAGWGVLGLSFFLMLLLLIGFFLAGFEPDRPGGRSQRPGLTRSQTNAVVERIRSAYEASPDSRVERRVTFPVFALREPQPQVMAERVLGPVPGYVVGSFELSTDQKAASFRYKGNKEVANQYALLLPGPTGIYISFTPQFDP